MHLDDPRHSAGRTFRTRPAGRHLRTARTPRLSRTTLVAVLALLAGLLGAAPAAAVGGSPLGNFEVLTSSVGKVTLSGWALDANTSGSIYLWVDISGRGQHIIANTSRADVGAAFPGLGNNHGFSATLAANAGNQRVCLTAINVDSGANSSLGCRTVSVPSGSPIGSFDALTTSPDAVTVSGWSIDPDTAGSVYVWADVSGSGRHLIANTSRPDVGAVFPAYGPNHGFSTTIPATPGPKTVCLTVVNVGSGRNSSLGCRTATVPSNTASSGIPAGRPGPDTTGVPAGQALSIHWGDLTISTAGAVVSNLDVRGFVKVTAPGVTIRNSIIRGGVATTSSRGLVSVTSNAASLTIHDSELYAANPSGFIDGLRGWNISAVRLDIHDVIDGAHIYGSNVTIQDSWIHDNLHFASDPNQGGGASHDDSIQIQQGSNIIIRNNTISDAFNTGIQLTQDQGAVSNVTISGNLADGGGCTINLAQKDLGPFQGVVVTNNTFGRDTRVANCAIISPTTTAVQAANNYFVDGAVAVVKNGS